MKLSKLSLYPVLAATCLCGLSSFQARAQSPGAIYTWNGTGNIEQWFRSFGSAGSTASLANSTPGELTITETSGTAGLGQAFSDDFNRVRELPTAPSGGLDLTGLSALQFDIGQSGAGNISVQFYVQASVSSTFVALGPDVTITPGLNTYQVPLTSLTANQAVYVRTIGMNIRDHTGVGNVTWSVQEVRSVGPALTSRTLANFDGTVEGGLQGAIVNFGNAGVTGNNGGQNQTGLSWNSAGTGSLQWTSPAGGAGGAISLGNGTAWNGNTFNNRTADVSNYERMIVRMKATETTTSDGGSVNVQSFFQKNNFGSFQSPGTDALPIDGQYHDLVFNIVGLTDMNVVDQTGLNIGTHTDELTFDVDNIMFMVPEPSSAVLLLGGFLGFGLARRRAQKALPKSE
jgi:hypothetical protein